MLVAALLGARQVQRSAQRAALERADSLRGAAFLEFARRFDGPGPDAPVVEVPLTALAPGDRVEVRSGELVPVDGVVLSGRSSLDNAVLTGEAAAVPGAGGRRGQRRRHEPRGAARRPRRRRRRADAGRRAARHRPGGALAEARRSCGRPTVVARRFVAGPARRSPSSPASRGSQRGPAVALERVVALLVVACPCALGLSVPLAMSVALLRAARAGIFIKNPDALERLAHGRHGAARQDRDAHRGPGDGRALARATTRALQFARALEAESSHAVARAFRSCRGPSLQGRADGRGRGRGSGAGHRRPAGRARRPRREPGPRRGGGRRRSRPNSTACAEAFVADGLSPVFVAVDGRVAGVAGIGDALRPDARRTIEALRARGIRVRILSGRSPRGRRARRREPRPAGRRRARRPDA